MKQGIALALSVMLTATAFAAPAPQAAASGSTKKKTRQTKTSTPSVSDQLSQMQQALGVQQRQIQQLMQQMQSRDAALQQAQQQAQQAQQQLQQAQTAAAEAQQKAASAETAANQQKDSVARLSNDMKDVQTTLTNNAVGTQDEQKRMSALEGLVGRFRFNGDVRVRGESFFQDLPTFLDRNRARVRVRFGFDGKLNEDFTAGIALATGSLGDPTTTNETFTNFFDRKTIGLDKGFITYNPVAHKWVSVTAGKFAYTWQRTSATFDPDLNPEGFSEKFSWDLKTPYLKNFTVGAMQMLFSEVSSGTDSYALGAHFSGKLQIGPLTSTPSFTLVKWNNPSAIFQASAFAVQAQKDANGGSTLPGEGPGCGKGSAASPDGSVSLPSFAPCTFSPNGMTNAVVIGPDGKTPRFLSGFFYADLIINNQIKTPLSRLPINLLVEYLDNLDAASHPLDTNGNVIPDLGSQNKEYGADISIGQTRNKNDIQVGYAWLRQEQDSAISSFNESDQRAPTNILQNRIYALWKLRSNTVAAFTWWHGRTLNTGLQNNAASVGKTITTAGQQEPNLNRYQFDLIYTF